MRITKDIFYIVPSLLLAGLTLLSCHRKEPVQPEKEPSIIEFTDGSSEDILFGLDGGSQTISFKTNYGWSASFASEPAGGWCSISPAEGPAGSNSIKVTASGNTSPDERTASFKIRSGDVEKTVTVTQKPSDAISIASTRIEFNPEGGTRLITAMSGYPCQASVSEDARSWISILSVRAVTTEVSIS
ncbi:MAG: BACON domain-containing protein, partial [Bacteroidales bacterium]|nr:BACON domain-containing protein [Bacteroidales bacterium]